MASTDQDPQVKYFAKKVLSILNSIKSKEDGDEPHEGLITKIVQSAPPETKYDKLKTILEAENPELRNKAVLAIIKENDPRYFQLIIDTINNEKNNHVLASMISAFKLYGDVSHLKYIDKFYDFNDYRVQANTIEVLGKIGSDKVIPVLEKFLNSENNRIRANAILMYKKFNYDFCLEELSKMLSSNNVDKVASAIYCIKNFDDERAIQLFRNVSFEDRDNQEEVINVLNKFSKSGSIVAGEILESIFAVKRTDVEQADIATPSTENQSAVENFPERLKLSEKSSNSFVGESEDSIADGELISNQSNNDNCEKSTLNKTHFGRSNSKNIKLKHDVSAKKKVAFCLTIITLSIVIYHIYYKLFKIKEQINIKNSKGKISSISTNYERKCGNDIFQIVKSKNSIDLDKILKNNCDVNKMDSSGFTPLLLAVKFDNSYAFRKLSEAGSDVNHQASTGETCLHIAVSECPSMLSIILDCKPNLKISDKNGDTAMRLAVKQKKWDLINKLFIASEEIIIESEKDLDILNYSILEHKEKFAIDVIDKIKDFDYVKDKLRPIITLACKENMWKLVFKLIDKNVDCNFIDSRGNSPLMYVVKNTKNSNIIENFLNQHPELNTKNNHGNTALHLAVEANNGSAITQLLKLNCDASLLNNNGDTPLNLAKKQGNNKLVEKLVKNGGAISAASSKILLSSKLIDSGISKKDLNILLGAFIEKKWDIVIHLLQAGVFLDNEPIFEKITLGAAKDGKFSIVDFYLKNSNNINIIDEYGESLLTYAAQYNQMQIVSTLISKSANLNFKNRNGDTALMIADKKKFKSLVDLLTGKISKSEAEEVAANFTKFSASGDWKKAFFAFDHYGISPPLKILWSDNVITIIKKINELNNLEYVRIQTEISRYKNVPDLLGFKNENEIYSALYKTGLNPSESFTDKWNLRKFFDKDGKEKVCPYKSEPDMFGWRFQPTVTISAYPVLISKTPFTLQVNLTHCPGRAICFPEDELVIGLLSHPLVITEIELTAETPILRSTFPDIWKMLHEKYHKYGINEISYNQGNIKVEDSLKRIFTAKYTRSIAVEPTYELNMSYLSPLYYYFKQIYLDHEAKVLSGDYRNLKDSTNDF